MPSLGQRRKGSGAVDGEFIVTGRLADRAAQVTELTIHVCRKDIGLSERHAGNGLSPCQAIGRPYNGGLQGGGNLCERNRVRHQEEHT